MKNHRDTIQLHSEHKEQIINITSELQGCLERSGIEEGMMLVFPLHTSCAVYLSDSDDNLTRDTQETLRSLIPSTPPGKKSVYHHNKRDPKQNAPAHLKAVLLGHHVTLPITEGEFDFGTYHTVYYAEFDGQRSKKILVKTIGQ